MSWSDLIGRQLGPYTILEEIGRGGSSHVFRASDTQHQREVAIKIIPNDAEDRVGFVRRFEREVQAVAQLNHPNIVRVYDRGETNDLVYLVMQCVIGGTLRQRLGRPLPPDAAAAAAIQMAEALHHAHLRGIIHRDVKPSNMLVDAEDERHLLLTDFGIAKLQGTRGLTRTGTTIGTPEYMAPEQAEGKEIDQRADVYALGCVLYEMLSGRPPFTGSTPVSVLYQQVHSRPAYIRGFNPDVPRELARVVEQALSKRPAERFGTAEAFAEALRPFANGQSASAVQRTGATPPHPASDGLRAVPPFPAAHAAGTPPDVPTPEPPSAAPSGSGAGRIWRGMGQEGLDALFPDDVETRKQAQAIPPPAGPSAERAAPPEASRTPSGKLHQTIPLPSFRLPARQTRPITGPLGEDWLDSMLGAPPAQQPPAGPPTLPWDPVPSQESIGPRMDLPAEEEPTTLLRRALLQTGELARVPADVWRPNLDELTPPPTRTVRRRRSGRRPLLAGGALAALVALSALTWVGLSASGLGLTLLKAHSSATTTPTVKVRATTAPTATPTLPPTATTDPHVALDQQAAASFRAVTLTTFADGTCGAGNSRTSFSSGQAVYVNLCSAANPVNAPMTVSIRQNGVVRFVLISNQPLSPSAGYWYARYGIAPGAYDVLVTVRINGYDAVARDLSFVMN